VTAGWFVKVPLVSTDSNTVIRIYYSKSDATDGEAEADTWNSAFVARYSMSDATTSTILDSTSNDNDGTKKGANEPIEATGKIGKAQDFDGTDDLILLGTQGTDYDGFNGTTWTFSAWVNPDNISNDQYVAGGIKDGGVDPPPGQRNIRAILLGFQDNYFNYFNQGKYPTNTAAHSQVAATAQTWQHLVLALSGTSYKAYKDGVEVVSLTATNGLHPHADKQIDQYTLGAGRPGGTYGKTLFDEVRVSDVARAAAWIKFEYTNMDSADQEMTWGAEQSAVIMPIFHHRRQLLMR
jgi:hypothetical protein